MKIRMRRDQVGKFWESSFVCVKKIFGKLYVKAVLSLIPVIVVFCKITNMSRKIAATASEEQE